MLLNEKVTAYRTLLTKEVLRFLRIWIQTILPSMIVTALYFVIFGKLLGEKIGRVEGLTYIEFIVPGLILMTVITNSYSNVVSSFYSAKFQRNIEEMLVSPMPNYVILIGFMSGGVARGLIVGLSVLLVSVFFVDIRIFNITVLISVCILTSILFSIAGFINALYAQSFDDISIIPTFVLTPLTYLGGIFYSASYLPGIWKDIALFNPILYMVNTFRYGFWGIDVPLLKSYIIVLVIIAGLYLYAISLLRSGKGLKG